MARKKCLIVQTGRQAVHGIQARHVSTPAPSPPTTVHHESCTAYHSACPTQNIDRAHCSSSSSHHSQTDSSLHRSSADTRSIIHRHSLDRSPFDRPIDRTQTKSRCILGLSGHSLTRSHLCVRRAHPDPVLPTAQTFHTALLHPALSAKAVDVCCCFHNSSIPRHQLSCFLFSCTSSFRILHHPRPFPHCPLYIQYTSYICPSLQRSAHALIPFHTAPRNA